MSFEKQALLLMLGFCFFLAPSVHAESHKTRYSLIVYHDRDQVRRFNNNIILSRRLYKVIRRQKNITIFDEVKNKIDAIVEKVELTLDMFPRRIGFKIVLLADQSEVKKIHKNLYHRNASFIAFFNPKSNTIYISVNDSNLKVLAHEIGHMIVESYFKISPPPKMHELLAQYAASHVID